jgi:hypothetical protein
MRTTRCLLATLVWVACAGHATVLAQDRLPTSKQEALTPDEQQRIRDYAAKWAGNLQSGTDMAVADAKKKLTAPLRRNPRSPFLTAYRIALIPHLREAISSRRDLVRLNVMIIAEAAKDAKNPDLLVTGIADRSPAVRYWAAAAMTSVIAALPPAETPKQQQEQNDLQSQLLAQLVKAMQVEPYEQVVQQCMAALNQLNIPEAAIEVLEAIDGRVVIHLRKPALPLTASLATLRKQMIQVIRQPNPPGNHVHMLMSVSFRYFSLASNMLANDRVPPSNLKDFREMLRRADENMRELAKLQGMRADDLPRPPLGQSLEDLIKGRQWQAINLYSAEWKTLLVARLKFKAETLRIAPTATRPDRD